MLSGSLFHLCGAQRGNVYHFALFWCLTLCLTLENIFNSKEWHHLSVSRLLTLLTLDWSYSRLSFSSCSLDLRLSGSLLFCGLWLNWFNRWDWLYRFWLRLHHRLQWRLIRLIIERLHQRRLLLIKRLQWWSSGMDGVSGQNRSRGSWKKEKTSVYWHYITYSRYDGSVNTWHGRRRVRVVCDDVMN